MSFFYECFMLVAVVYKNEQFIVCPFYYGYFSYNVLRIQFQRGYYSKRLKVFFGPLACHLKMIDVTEI